MNNMKIYLAARYSRIEEMNKVKTDLEKMGHTITSRWINGNHQIKDDELNSEAKRLKKLIFATEDLEDLESAECCISFTEEARSTNSRGGRHVEFGLALAMRQRCIVVGPIENVFHLLPVVEHYHNYQDFILKFN